MIIDNENDRQMLLAIMKQVDIKGNIAIPFAILMNKVQNAALVNAEIPEGGRTVPAPETAKPVSKPKK